MPGGEIIPLGKGQASETGMEPSLTVMCPKYCFFATFHVHFLLEVNISSWKKYKKVLPIYVHKNAKEGKK